MVYCVLSRPDGEPLFAGRSLKSDLCSVHLILSTHPMVTRVLLCRGYYVLLRPDVEALFAGTSVNLTAAQSTLCSTPTSWLPDGLCRVYCVLLRPDIEALLASPDKLVPNEAFFRLLVAMHQLDNLAVQWCGGNIGTHCRFGPQKYEKKTNISINLHRISCF